MSIRCLLGFHHRSRRHAHDRGHAVVSKCARCGIPMEKAPNGRWIVDKAKPESESAVE
jgi:hypothetical protein